MFKGVKNIRNFYVNIVMLELLKKYKIIEYGDFTLKSKEKSNFYINIKKSISYPYLHKKLCLSVIDKIKIKDNIMICGTPYGALSFTSYISITQNIPMIFLRKEAKKYGCKNLIEGDFLHKDLILIEDVVTTGNSVIDTAKVLEENGFNIIQIITIFSRNSNELMYKNIPIEYAIKL